MDQISVQDDIERPGYNRVELNQLSKGEKQVLRTRCSSSRSEISGVSEKDFGSKMANWNPAGIFFLHVFSKDAVNRTERCSSQTK